MKEIKISDGMYGFRTQHKDCKICDKHPFFDLEDMIFIHGQWYTKREILKALKTITNQR